MLEPLSSVLCPMLFMTYVTLFSHIWMIFQPIQLGERTILNTSARFFFAADVTILGSILTSASSAYIMVVFWDSSSPKMGFALTPSRSRSLLTSHPHPHYINFRVYRGNPTSYVALFWTMQKWPRGLHDFWNRTFPSIGMRLLNNPSINLKRCSSMLR